jgi:hypothetical protein
VEQSSTEFGPPHWALVPCGGGGLLQLAMFEGTQFAASGEPVPVHAPALQPCPLSTHWPLGHWLSAVQRHAVCDALHTPLLHEYGIVAVHPIGSVVDGSAQSRSLWAPLPVHEPAAQPWPTSTH